MGNGGWRKLVPSLNQKNWPGYPFFEILKHYIQAYYVFLDYMLNHFICYGFNPLFAFCIQLYIICYITINQSDKPPMNSLFLLRPSQRNDRHVTISPWNKKCLGFAHWSCVQEKVAPVKVTQRSFVLCFTVCYFSPNKLSSMAALLHTQSVACLHTWVLSWVPYMAPMLL